MKKNKLKHFYKEIALCFDESMLIQKYVLYGNGLEDTAQCIPAKETSDQTDARKF